MSKENELIKLFEKLLEIDKRINPDLYKLNEKLYEKQSKSPVFTSVQN